MAKTKTSREPGRIKQLVQVYKTTKQYDKTLPLVMALAFIIPVIVAVLAAWLLPGGGIAAWILWPITGLLAGILIALIVLGKRAEAMAYAQIEGRQGAVGAVMASGLRRSWRGSEIPVAVNPRSQEAVYRAVGKGGIALIGEGNPQKVQRLLQDEERKIKRILPNVTVTKIYAGNAEGQIPLAKLAKELNKLKRSLNRYEIQAVHQRLSSLQSQPLAMPKGVDPLRMRKPSRPR